MLLEWTVQVLPGVRLVLCEPFVLPVDETRQLWRSEVDQRRAVVADLAREFGTSLVPFQKEFDGALQSHDAKHLAPDGVHPTEFGHDLMAEWWIRHVSRVSCETNR